MTVVSGVVNTEQKGSGHEAVNFRQRKYDERVFNVSILSHSLNFPEIGYRTSSRIFDIFGNNFSDRLKFKGRATGSPAATPLIAV